MIKNIIIVIVLTSLTTGIHAGGMILAMRLSQFDRSEKLARKFFNPLYLPWFRVSNIVLLMFIISVLEVALWASAYYFMGAFKAFEPAIYFSMVTFTTLGYGEIVLGPDIRLLASCEAAIGIIMFGWTTAIVIATVQRYYFNQDVIPELDIGSPGDKAQDKGLPK